MRLRDIPGAEDDTRNARGGQDRGVAKERYARGPGLSGGFEEAADKRQSRVGLERRTGRFLEAGHPCPKAVLPEQRPDLSDDGHLIFAWQRAAIDLDGAAVRNDVRLGAAGDDADIDRPAAEERVGVSAQPARVLGFEQMDDPGHVMDRVDAQIGVRAVLGASSVQLVLVVFASLGCYAINGNHFDVHAIAVFGIIGYVLVKLGCEPAPLLLGFVLGPLLEEHLRRAMILSRGDPMIFLERPISAVLLVLAVAVLVVAVLPTVRRKRDEVFVEED